MSNPEPDDLLGSLEARIMEDVWEHGRSSVNDVLDRLNSQTRKQLAYNTVMSVMARLERKGFLERERSGRAFIYWAPASREEFIVDRAAAAAREFLEDYGAAALTGLVQEVRQEPELLDELRRLVSSAR